MDNFSVLVAYIKEGSSNILNQHQGTIGIRYLLAIPEDTLIIQTVIDEGLVPIMINYIKQ